VCAEASGEVNQEVRPCRREHLAEIEAILQVSPEAAPWTAAPLAEIFKQHMKYFFISAENQKVTGFIAGRRVLEEAEVLNLAVHPSARERGAGGALLRVLLEEFRREKVVNAFLEVRESNLFAIAFYRKFGFEQVGKRPGYYRGPDEAALVLAVRLSSATPVRGSSPKP
jgi:[ribosomal protein S18]-alanine N-acetyltransferase